MRMTWMGYLCTLALLLPLITAEEEVDFQTPFSYIYKNHIWNDQLKGPLSGGGSDACEGLPYLLYLQHLIDRPEVKRIVEIGFGDWEMMQHILLEHKTYIGYEVVQQIMRKSEHNLEYRLEKTLRDVNDTGDLLIVRDVMMHWPRSEIEYLKNNILPRFRYALLSNDYTPN
jgi:hypothetical protein